MNTWTLSVYDILRYDDCGWTVNNRFELDDSIRLPDEATDEQVLDAIKSYATGILIDPHCGDDFHIELLDNQERPWGSLTREG